jgi:PDZ domain-containing secreted protein
MSYRDDPQRLMEDGVYAVVNEADSSSKIMRKGDSVRVVDGRLTQVQGENTA